MQALLGKDNPYKNAGSLSTALKADKDSFDYKASHNLKDDYAQYKEWCKIIGKENMPQSLEEFQQLKYNDNNKFEYLEAFKEYRADNPKATQLDYQRVVKLKEAGIKGEIHIPPLALENIENMEFDDYHANIERGHNVTKEDAISYIKDAKITIIRWNGRCVNFYGENGSTYVLDGRIRTAFKVNEYDDDTKQIIEVMNDE